MDLAALSLFSQDLWANILPVWHSCLANKLIFWKYGVLDFIGMLLHAILIKIIAPGDNNLFLLKATWHSHRPPERSCKG